MYEIYLQVLFNFAGNFTHGVLQYPLHTADLLARFIGVGGYLVKHSDWSMTGVRFVIAKVNSVGSHLSKRLTPTK